MNSPARRIVLSAAVITHPVRKEAARALVEQHPELDLQIVVDPRPDDPPWALRTAVEGWRRAGPHATHHLVLQDDVSLCAGFAGHLHEALRARPDDALSFFTDWNSRSSGLLRQAALNRRSWAPVISAFVPTQAMVLPSEPALELSGFMREHAEPGEPDDVAALRFLRSAGIRPLMSVPSLVEHLDVPSIVGNNHLGVRRAACFLPEPPSALRWDRGVLESRATPYVRWPGGDVFCLVDRTGTDQDWDRTPAAEFLAERGCSPAAVGRALAAVPPGTLSAEAAGAVPDSLLLRLWQAGALLGMTARDIGGPSAVPPSGDAGDIARAAVDSLVFAVLRGEFDIAAIERLAGSLTALVRVAVVWGHGKAAAGENGRGT
ncbi:hypothetical protein [Streptomyces sp. NPDC060022]|uniref:hypothetical protein n=1 Tax=Streptomyces sp. NPDC060022 TaxID=3347039 RepID=UPI003683E672